MRVKPTGPAAQILRALIARPLTRRELCGSLGLSQRATDHHVSLLQAIRAIEPAGNVRSPTGCGWVLMFRATPDAWARFEAAKLGDPPPQVTPARLELLALLAGEPATVDRIATTTNRSKRNARKVTVEMLARGLVSRTGGVPAVYSVTDSGRAMLADMG